MVHMCNILPKHGVFGNRDEARDGLPAHAQVIMDRFLPFSVFKFFAECDQPITRLENAFNAFSPRIADPRDPIVHRIVVRGCVCHRSQQLAFVVCERLAYFLCHVSRVQCARCARQR